MRFSLALAVMAVLAIAAASPFPAYTQCQEPWGTQAIGTVQHTGAFMCTDGASTTAVATAMTALNMTLPDDKSVPTPGNLNRYLSAYQYHDECGSAACVERVPLAVFFAINPKLKVHSARPLKPLGRHMCRRIARARGVLFAELASGVQRLVVACDGESVLVRNTATGADDAVPVTAFVSSTYIGNAAGAGLETIPKQYPLYKQCDGRWGQHMMITKTLCAVGCLVSSVSMALSGWGIKSNGHASNPGTLNEWLRGHQGYVDGNMFALDRMPAICHGEKCEVIWPHDGYHGDNDLHPETIIGYLSRHRIVIAHVRDKTHFVLGTGWSSDRATLIVNDPAGRNETHFHMHSGVNGWRLFDFKA